MGYLQVQRNTRREGGRFEYVHLAKSVWDAGRGRSVQKRVYVGRLDRSGKRLVLSKGYGGRGGTTVELAELRRRLAAGEDLDAWLRLPAGAGAPRDLPVGVSIVGDGHVLFSVATQTQLAALVEESFGAEDGPVLMALALHQAAEGRAVYLAADWLDDREVLPAARGERLQTDQVYTLIAAAGADQARQERFFRG